MIANRGRERMIGKSDFRAAVAYIVRDGPQHERDHEPPLAVWSSRVASIETAAFEMTATASQSKAKDPLYHLIVSWDEGEHPTYEQARAALDAQMRHLGFSGLQYVAALQNDGVGGKYHIHAVINRVDPRTHVAREIWQDRDRMQAACREVELEQGWRVVASHAHERAQTRGLSHGARDAEYYGRKQSFERRVRDDLGPALRARLTQDGATWETLHAFCREQGIRYEPVMRGEVVAGARITGTERGEFARARELGEDLTHRALLERLGMYEPDRTMQARRPFAERCRAAAAEVGALRPDADGVPGWARAHVAFERHGVEYQAVGTGARIVDLDGAETAKASDVERGLSMSAMRERFGAFETTAQARERAAAREVVRHAESLVVGSRLLEDPSPILERLTATRATFTLRDAERVIAEKVHDPEQRQAVLKAVVAQSVMLADERVRTRMTTREVLEAERTLDAAARGLAQAPQAVAITRDAGAHLDEQQRRAYAYAVADDARLKVVTGVPGSGKTTLIADIAAAYEEAGYRVRAVSVANAAVQVLEREAKLPARSVAKELHQWSQGRAQLGGGVRDVLIVDEVSTLGTAQGAELLRAAHERGATVLAFGDDKQFQAVAHGNALAFMQRAVGENTIDLTQTRRQREEWQREATHAVRRGDVRGALDAYRGRDCIREHDTQAQARTALVERWEQIERGGVECGVEAFTNAERIAVNELARERWRAMGRLSGADAQLETIDGRVPYAVGDRVVIRETIREAGLFNGSVGIVRGIDGAALQIERRDGEVVHVSTRAHPGVQHGYCSTEYREQGSTRYAELQLVTQHVNQRSLTVGMTRHTDAYEMFYAKETVGSYEDLVGLGLRTRSKDLASDYREQAPQRETPTLARESVAEPHAPEPARVSVRSVEQLRDELQSGVNAAAAQARADARMMPTFLAQYKRQGAIETRLQALARSGVRDIPLERFGRGDFEDRLGQVERALDQIEPRETVVDAAVSRSEPMPTVEREVAAPSERDSYEKLHEELSEREDKLMVRSVALAREREALRFVPEPMEFARQVNAMERAIREEARQAAAFTVIEAQRLHEAQAHRQSWNPLMRPHGERTERDLLVLQTERYERALQTGMERFAREGKPRMAEAFMRESGARATWEKHLSRITDEQGHVTRELYAVGNTRAELAMLEQSGVPAVERDGVSGEQKEALRDIFERSETFAQSMRQELRPMGRGESVEGVLAWKKELPGGKAAMVLINDGNGTLHRGIVQDAGDMRTGNRVTFSLTRDAQATLSRGPEQGRGMSRGI